MSTEGISFAGYTIAVTGGASGIGLAVARGLARKSATVHVADITQQTPPELKGQTNVHFTGGLDVSSRADCKAFIDAIPGRLDGLVNCAGICPPEGQMASDATYQRVFAVNVTGTWNMGTEAITRMNQQKPRVTEGLLPGTKRDLPGGSIVNISSGAGLRSIGGVAVYCASKHAVVGLTRAWALDWPCLRINSVAPGVTDTPLVQGAHIDNGEDRDRFEKLTEQLKQRIPLGRMAYPTDIADSVLFLLSDASSYTTGQILLVSGGSE